MDSTARHIHFVLSVSNFYHGFSHRKVDISFREFFHVQLNVMSKIPHDLCYFVHRSRRVMLLQSCIFVLKFISSSLNTFGTSSFCNLIVSSFVTKTTNKPTKSTGE